MKQFTMSEFVNKTDLYKSKSEYMKTLATNALGRLIELEEVSIDDDGRYIWRSCGEYVGGDE
jgi:hypothetical protein